jgi:hypothetical protein
MTSMSSVPFELSCSTSEGMDEDRAPHRRVNGDDASLVQGDPEPNEEGWRYGEFGPGWHEFTEALERFRTRPRP